MLGKGIQQPAVGLRRGKLFFGHGRGIKGSGRYLFQYGTHSAVVVAVRVGDDGGRKRLYPCAGKRRQHPTA